MFKQLIAIILLSILVVLFMSYMQEGLHFVIIGEEWVSNLLKSVFSNVQAGNLIRQVLALLAIPVLIATIPVLLYWLVRRHWFPYFMELVWVLWLIQTAALIILFKAAV